MSAPVIGLAAVVAAAAALALVAADIIRTVHPTPVWVRASTLGTSILLGLLAVFLALTVLQLL